MRKQVRTALKVAHLIVQQSCEVTCQVLGDVKFLRVAEVARRRDTYDFGDGACMQREHRVGRAHREAGEKVRWERRGRSCVGA